MQCLKNIQCIGIVFSDIFHFLQMKLIYMTIKKSDKNTFQIFNYNAVVLRVISYNSLMTREY